MKQDEFCFEPHEHHQRDALDTSVAAAHAIEHEARALMMRILRHLRDRGPLTRCEIARGLGLTEYQTSKRLSDLKNQGFIIDTGQRRPGPSRRLQAVWVAR